MTTTHFIIGNYSVSENSGQKNPSIPAMQTLTRLHLEGLFLFQKFDQTTQGSER